MSRVIPLLPLWAVRLIQSLSACTRVTFTFTIFYVKTNLHIWKCMTEFFLKWGIFPSTILEKINAHILSSIFFSKIYLLRNNVEYFGIRRQTTDDKLIRRMRFACEITGGNKCVYIFIISNNCCFSTPNGNAHAHRFYVTSTTPVLLL